MSTTITVEEAQASLEGTDPPVGSGGRGHHHREPAAGGETGERTAAEARVSGPAPGLGKGMITFIAPDFDAPLEDMKEYME